MLAGPKLAVTQPTGASVFVESEAAPTSAAKLDPAPKSETLKATETASALYRILSPQLKIVDQPHANLVAVIIKDVLSVEAHVRIVIGKRVIDAHAAVFE